MRTGSRRARAIVAILAASLALVAVIGPVSAARVPKGLNVSLSDAGPYDAGLGGCASELQIRYSAKNKVDRFQIAGPLIAGGGWHYLDRETGRVILTLPVTIQFGDGARVSVDAQLGGTLQAFAYSNYVDCR